MVWIWFGNKEDWYRDGQFKNFKWIPNLSNFVLSNGLKNVQNVIQMTVKWLSFSRNCENCQWLGVLPPVPSQKYTWIASVCSACRPIATLFEQDYFNFLFQAPYQNPCWSCKDLFDPVNTGYVVCPPSLEKFLRAPLADCKKIFIAVVVFLCFGSYIWQYNLIST